MVELGALLRQIKAFSDNHLLIHFAEEASQAIRRVSEDDGKKVDKLSRRLYLQKLGLLGRED
ncbi:hypothetical protein F373_gp090 [Bacillus phage SP-10]|uniref:hypothetical protein n=1 Tax=Bacillus phage SP10 TaxID=941058 RepID=UPI0002198B2E|nr:hypothetical protein F373_gp090 [Bacillus phage SP-10]BAK52902.1 hypothetical protein [Bacillus phage SP-10]